MKKAIFLGAFSVLLCAGAFTQNVLVAGAVVGNGSYPDLGSAFTAINSGAQTGAAITISIVGNTTEPVTASLNQGAWTSLTISPSGGAARTLSGNITGALVQLDGADNVTINGLNTGGNSLIIDNSNTGTTSTLRLVNDAQNNLFTNLTLRGANTSTANGTVSISTGVTNGNDNNIFSNSTFDASGANFPIYHLVSIGTAGAENSSITVNNCNFANFFNANSISAGIYVQNNSDAWTITNNRFYQSALRTYTTANTHRGIYILTGSGYSVSGNTIGYATSAGTGTYAMTGTIAVRFIAIDLSVGTAATSSVQGNTVTAITINSSSGASTTYGVLCGISISSGNVNVGNVTPNIIGGTTGVDRLVVVPTTSNGAVVGIHTGSTGTVLISNNSIGGLTSSGSTAAVSGTVHGIFVSGVAASLTISNNTIGNASADNMRSGTNGLTTGSSSASGIFMNALPTAGTVSGNTIQNLTSYGTGTGGAAYVRGIQTLAATGNTGSVAISGNTIFNLNTNSGLTTLTSGQASAVGIHIGAGTNMVVNGNTIYNVGNSNNAATQRYVAGITQANATNTALYGNRIYGLYNASTSTNANSPGVVVGVLVRSGTNALNIYNNMISLGTGQTSNTVFVGVLNNDGSTPDPSSTNIYHNTILITGTAAAGALNSFGYHRGDFSATSRNVVIDFRNNLVVNERTGGTGQHFAIGNNSTAIASNTGWGTNASNYNILNASVSTIGHWGGALNMANWRTASAGDGNSNSGATVVFVNSANDLHLNMGTTPNLMESSGQTIAGYTTDYDNQTRPGPAGSVNGGALAPDIGADEFDGVILDIAPPQINYTPLIFTCSTGDRNVTATITDLTGTDNTAAFRPRIYFRKNSGTWYSNQGTLVSGTVTSGTWNFSITTATMGGVATGDIIEYFIIAQDVVTPTANVGSNPGTGLVATNVNTISTYPTSPSSYPIANTISGTYTVGVAGIYPTLTAAVNAYNTNCLGGPVIFELLDATYPSETFPITIQAHQNASAINTLTIRPATGVNTSIIGSASAGLLILNGADYVTLDGSNASTVNTVCPPVSATRNLTLTNTGTGVGASVVMLSSLGTGAGASHNIIRNCILSLGVDQSTTATDNYAILFSSGVPGLAPPPDGADNDYNTIENNVITRCAWGIYVRGSANGINDGNSIRQNLIGPASFGSEQIRRGGIVMQFQDSATVSGNEVRFIGTLNNQAAGGNDRVGIGLGGFECPVPTVTDFSNGIVTQNNIHDIVEEKTFSAVGLQLAAINTQPTGNLIANNMIANVHSNATSPDFGIGLYIYSGNTDEVLFNTVQMVCTDRDSGSATTATQPDMGIRFFTNALTPDFQNNLVYLNEASSTTTVINYAMVAPSAGYVWGTSNYNNYAILSSNAQNALFGLGTGPFTAVNSLAAWQGTFTPNQDAQSLNVVPVFVSTTNAHLVAASNPLLQDAANPLVLITTDMDCDTRDNNCGVDIGADETGPSREINVQGNGISIASGTTTTSAADLTDFGTLAVCNGTASHTFVLQNLGYTDLIIDSITVSGANASSFSLGSILPSTISPMSDSSFTLVFDAAINGLHQATLTIYSNDCSEGIYTFALSGTGTQIAITSLTSTNISCNSAGDGTATVSVSGGLGTVAYNWLPGNPNGDGTNTVINLGPGTWSCIVTDSTGCTDSTSIVITEPSALTSSQTLTLCFGESVTVGSNTYTSTGVYTDVLTAANGCDSTVTTDLTVNPAIDVTFIHINETISANLGGASYQWIDCDNNNAPIAGETGQSFTATSNGTYAVIITLNNCSDTSACENINSVGLDDPENPYLLQVYPNPSDGQFTLVTENYGLEKVEIYNALGEKLYEQTITAAQVNLNMQYLPAGAYYLKATGTQHIRTVRLIIR